MLQLDDEARSSLVEAAMCAGQWLADQEHPGRWDLLEPAGVLAGVDFLPPREREAFVLSLAGLVGAAGFLGYVPPATSQAQLEEIARLAGSPAIDALVRTAVGGTAGLTRAAPKAPPS